ncbi:MAG: transposase [Phycisphaerales bacterium]|nr:transposase [Phycisphaerales bacterium]
MSGGIDKRHGAYLPHWTRDGATYSATFRLVDSLPVSVLAGYVQEREGIVARAAANGRELSALERARLDELHSERIEAYLDSGAGACWLRDERVAELVQGALMHFEGVRYEVFAWCVMPNHVHAVFRPREGFGLSAILHSWKGFTSSEANKLLGRTGAFWQPESYDHLIRDEEEFAHAVRYVLENPAKAGLRDWQWVGCRGV